MKHTQEDFDAALEQSLQLWMKIIAASVTDLTPTQTSALRAGFKIGAHWAKNWTEQEDD